jgi:ribosome-associated protein
MSESSIKRDILKLQRTLVDALEDVKAKDIQIFNTEHLSPLFERVIIASGNSNRQTRALAASVRDAVRATGADKPRMEGEDNGEWVIVDCGAAVVHIMQPIIREYYRLEEIWGDKPVKMRLSGKGQKLVKAEATPEPEAKKPKRSAAAPKPAPAAKPATAKRVPAKPVTPSGSKPAGKAATKVAAKGAAKPVAKKAAAPKPSTSQAVLKVEPKKSDVKKAAARSAATKPRAKPAAPRTAAKPAAKTTAKPAAKKVVAAKRAPAAKKPATRSKPKA